jgi:hypothetical protein
LARRAAGDVAQGRGARVARARVLGHRRLDDLARRRRDVRRQRRRLVPDVAHGDLERVLPLERPAAGQTLVGHHAERVHVGQRRGALPGGLLGRDVGRGAEHRSGRGELADHGRAGDAEVGEHQGAVRPHQQVARLHVPVNDALLVRGVQRVGRLRHERHRAGRGEPADARERARERVALDILHDQERGAVLAAVVVDVDDTGVVDRRHRAGLAAEPLLEARLLQQGREQHLHRHGSAEHVVGAAPHVAHAAAGDALVQAVPAAQHRAWTQHVSLRPP